MVAAVAFETAAERYVWLTAAPAAWIGEFDTASYRHRYRVYRAAGSAGP